MEVEAATKIISPEGHILCILSPEDRLGATFKVAREAFERAKPIVRDIDHSVKLVRRKTYGRKR
jgi:hypothetical protein